MNIFYTFNKNVRGCWNWAPIHLSQCPWRQVGILPTRVFGPFLRPPDSVLWMSGLQTEAALEPFLSSSVSPRGHLGHTQHSCFQLGGPWHSGREDGDPLPRQGWQGKTDTEKCNSFHSSPDSKQVRIETRGQRLMLVLKVKTGLPVTHEGL